MADREAQGEGGLAIAVLAAGASRRFGNCDKLAARCGDLPLGLHGAAKLAHIPAQHRWVITSRADHPCAQGWRESGFALEVNGQAQEGIGTSLALAARLALNAKSRFLLVALADMPLVPASHFRALVAAAHKAGAGAIAVSGPDAGPARMPPAIFGQGHFPALLKSSGDKGARDLLGKGLAIACPQDWLMDVDTPAMLDRVRPFLP